MGHKKANILSCKMAGQDVFVSIDCTIDKIWWVKIPYILFVTCPTQNIIKNMRKLKFRLSI